MNFYPIISNVVAAAMMLAATAYPTIGETMQQEAIQARINGMVSAFEAGDIPGILTHYEKQAVVFGQPGSSATGSPALTALFQSFIDVDPKFTFHSHEIVEAGDIALHSSRWTMTGKLPDGTAIEDAGLSVVVLRKQADGEWLMVIDNPYGDHLMRGH